MRVHLTAHSVRMLTILLWDGDELVYALQKQAMRRALRAKYRFCIERSLPVYNIRIEDIP